MVFELPGTSENFSPSTESLKSRPKSWSFITVWKNRSGFLSCSLQTIKQGEDIVRIIHGLDLTSFAKACPKSCDKAIVSGVRVIQIYLVIEHIIVPDNI